MFIYCVNPYNYDVSLELDNNTIVDIDTEGKPVAFEFLNASQVFGLLADIDNKNDSFDDISKILDEYEEYQEIKDLIEADKEFKMEKVYIFLY